MSDFFYEEAVRKVDKLICESGLLDRYRETTGGVRHWKRQIESLEDQLSEAKAAFVSALTANEHALWEIRRLLYLNVPTEVREIQMPSPAQIPGRIF